MSDLVAYVDGGSLGNPGPSGIGVIIDGCDDGPIRIQKWIGHQDNNVAEYLALLEALQRALDMSARALHVYSDSEIVVKQMRGEYSCRSPRLYSLNWICRKLARSLQFSISNVPREKNREANSLASKAARNRFHGNGPADLATAEGYLCQDSVALVINPFCVTRSARKSLRNTAKQSGFLNCWMIGIRICLG